LRAFIEKAAWVTVNDYEWHLMRERTGLSPEEVAARVEALVITRGAPGSQIFAGSGCYEFPPVTPRAIADPTGCGDAYRAGLLFGILNDLDWATTGRIASLMGAIKIECAGTQNHRATRPEFELR
ncbi:MAG: PfkB family carbohydrate kinase, partial [Gammaproteobacteria bacterium]